MAGVIYGRRAVNDLERLFSHIAEHNTEAGLAAAGAIRSAVETLRAHPFIGRRTEGELRELVISFGKTGYLALYRFIASKDQVRILAIRHQHELDYQF